MKLLGKLIVTGHIEAKTGLAIGGSKTDVVIGGIDNNVIKNAEGVPYIPGSSLKGKLRSLLERKEGIQQICYCGKKDCVICTVFGKGIESKDNKENKKIEEQNDQNAKQSAGPTRIYVRDAKLNDQTKWQMEKKEGIFSDLELPYTEGKWENTINRLTSQANPRQQERVPAGSLFDLNIIYNLLTDTDIDYFKQVLSAFRLLEDDYLGGNGSRGYGRVKFTNLTITLKTVHDYEIGTSGTEIYNGSLEDLHTDLIQREIKRIIKEEE